MARQGAKIRELCDSDFDSVLAFADRHIGLNYFSENKLREIVEASRRHGVMCSFVLEDQGELKGIRLTYAPGQWAQSETVHEELWQTKLQDTAYFQSLFIADDYQAQGWGRRLSMASVENLRKIGTRAVVCHSWCESPNNSSRRYLDSLGFQSVISIKNFWSKIDYECTRCGRPCACTATEMILYI